MSVGFLGEEKARLTREKPLGAEERTNNKLNPHDNAESGIDPRVTLVGGEYSHHFIFPTPPSQFGNMKIASIIEYKNGEKEK